MSHRPVAPGVFIEWGGTTLPFGYLWADGSAVSQTTYAALFARFGTTYNTGGEGAGNFRLPDRRGRVGIGRDDMGGVAANRITAAGSGITGTTLGASGGTQTHTLSGAESGVPVHGHTASQAAHNHFSTIAGGGGDNSISTGGGATNNLVARSANAGNGNADWQTNSATPIVTVNNNSAAAAANAHQNTQPGEICNVIVKY